MEEKRIISMIGFYGSIIMATTPESEVLAWLWALISFFWMIRYIYLTNI